MRRLVRTEKQKVILPRVTVKVPVYIYNKAALPDRDFLFEPNLEGVYIYIVNVIPPFVYIANLTNELKVIGRYIYLSIIIEYNEEYYFYIDFSRYPLISVKTNIKVSAPLNGIETILPNRITVFNELD